MMSYILTTLCKYCDEEANGDFSGQKLYHALYDSSDDLKEDWEQTYTLWLRHLCDKQNIPKNQFRGHWIHDCRMSPASDEALAFIKENFKSDLSDKNTAWVFSDTGPICELCDDEYDINPEEPSEYCYECILDIKYREENK